MRTRRVLELSRSPSRRVRRSCSRWLLGPAGDSRGRARGTGQVAGARRRRAAAHRQRRPADDRRAEVAVARRTRRRARRRRVHEAGAAWTRSAPRSAAAAPLAARGAGRRRSTPSSASRTFSTASRPRSTASSVALLERDSAVQGIYPVRAALPGVGLVGRARAAFARFGGRQRRPVAAGLRRTRRDDRAARHRCRPRSTRPSSAASAAASTSSIRRATQRRRPRPAGPATSSGTGPSSPACSSATGGPAVSHGIARARASSRFASRAGRQTAAAATPCTRARTS